VLADAGNKGEDGTEGARYREVYATYLHGPVLPKNP
jgi:lipid II isoglutaminyl synthase (glutamine-hydrolysing)